ncbi:hypothetical protein BCAR13_1140026 [Paraburkholderia caribensis]|nr:hypothetical protein BCAR13_1140026 [Paraburkholderia caribensis]
MLRCYASKAVIVKEFLEELHEEGRKAADMWVNSEEALRQGPFTGEERWFDVKPATVWLKVRALKKLKNAAA